MLPIGASAEPTLASAHRLFLFAWINKISLYVYIELIAF